MAAAAIKYFILTLLFAGVSFGGQIVVTSTAQLTSANSSAVSGDTVLIAAGTYLQGIYPAANNVTYMWSTVGSVCSLYVSSGTAIAVDGFDSIRVIGIRAQTAWSVAGHALDMSNTDHFLMQYCRIYGGTTRSGQGDYTAFRFLNAHYGRIYNCLFDRQDPVVTTDDDQGDGVSWYESSHLIFEYDTVRNVSHAAWYGPATRSGSTPAWAQLNGPVVMRNCVAYDSHNPYDLQNAGHTILVDGCKGWSPMVKNSYKGGHTTEWAIERSIIRYGMFYNDSTRTQTSGYMNNSVNAFISMTGMGPYGLRVYNNAFLAAPYGDPLPAWSLFISEDGNVGEPFGHSVYANNIVANPSDTVLLYYQDRAVAHANITDTLKGNLWWAGSPGGNIADIMTDEDAKKTLATAKTYNSNFFQASNIEASPLWVDSTSVRGSRSFEISGTSLAKDAGVALTRLRAGASSSTVLQVADAKYFWYPHSNPYDAGDSVAIWHSGDWTRCLVDSVDTTNNNIVVHAAVTLSAGDSVYLLAGYVASTGTYTNRLSGTRPDIGPYEIAQGDGGGTTIPDTTTHVAPANGSTQAQPVTFRWRSVAGATTYWLTASYDNWLHDHVSVQTADTFYTYSGFPVDTTVIWNVQAGNSAGWSAWTAIWSFNTQAEVTYGDTLTVNWNNVFESETLTDNTVIQMANLQRRDNVLVIKNPSGRLIDWPTTIRWPGLETAPQPAAGDTVAYWLIRDGSNVYGFALGSQSYASTGITAGWVTNQLGRYEDTAQTQRVINVAAFGARADGSTADNASIQNAIDFAASLGGGVVYLPKTSASYKLDTTLFMASNVSIRGDGVLSTLSTTKENLYLLRMDSVAHSSVEGVRFSGAATNPGIAVYVSQGSSYSAVKNCIIDGAYLGVAIVKSNFESGHTSPHDISVTDNTILHAELNGVGISCDGYRLDVSGNDIIDSGERTEDGQGGAGIEARGISYSTISRNRIRGGQYSGGGYYVDGIRVELMTGSPNVASHHLAINGNTIGGVSGDGINGLCIDHSSITGNVIDSCASAISINGSATYSMRADGNVVSGNVLRDCSSGIIFNGGTNANPTGNAVTGNVISRMSTYGIFLDQAHRNVVVGGVISECGDYGVYALNAQHNYFNGVVVANSSDSLSVGGFRTNNADSSVFAGIVAYDNSGFGLSISSNCAGIVVSGAVFNGNTSGPYIDQGTGTRITDTEGMTADSVYGRVINITGDARFRDNVLVDTNLTVLGYGWFEGGINSFKSTNSDVETYYHTGTQSNSNNLSRTWYFKGQGGTNKYLVQEAAYCVDTTSNSEDSQYGIYTMKDGSWGQYFLVDKNAVKVGPHTLSVRTDAMRSNADTWMSMNHGSIGHETTTQGGVANRLIAWPFMVNAPYGIDSMRFEVTTAQTGSHVAFGIYEDQNGDLLPDSLRVPLGAYTTTSNAVVADTVSIAYTFKPNTLYFLAVNANGGTPATLRAMSPRALQQLLGHNPAIGTGANYLYWSKSSTYTYPDALPSLFPQDATRGASAYAPPIVMWRVKP